MPRAKKVSLAFPPSLSSWSHRQCSCVVLPAPLPRRLPDSELLGRHAGSPACRRVETACGQDHRHPGRSEVSSRAQAAAALVLTQHLSHTFRSHSTGYQRAAEAHGSVLEEAVSLSACFFLCLFHLCPFLILALMKPGWRAGCGVIFLEVETSGAQATP